MNTRMKQLVLSMLGTLLFAGAMPAQAQLRLGARDRQFGGRAQPLMSQLIESGKLTLDDIEEARKVLRKSVRKE